MRWPKRPELLNKRWQFHLQHLPWSTGVGLENVESYLYFVKSILHNSGCNLHTMKTYLVHLVYFICSILSGTLSVWFWIFHVYKKFDQLGNVAYHISWMRLWNDPWKSQYSMIISLIIYSMIISMKVSSQLCEPIKKLFGWHMVLTIPKYLLFTFS